MKPKETKHRVAIQGIRGSNHHVAAMRYFGDPNIECDDCDTFRELAQKVKKNPAVLGIMAIENTIAGSILQNYRIVRDSNLVIVGECKLRISHALVAMQGVELDQIREVNSHPMALMQCADYLDTLPNVKIVEKDDTAGSAKYIQDNKLKNNAAICPESAAQIYGMNILAKGIETNKRNFTRFLVLAHKSVAKYFQNELNINKSSIVFSLPHSSGSLSKVLSVLSFYDMNLTMIQSLPIIGKEWEYQFYVNLRFDEYKRYKQAIDAIRPLTNEFEILGEYEEGNYYLE